MVNVERVEAPDRVELDEVIGPLSGAGDPPDKDPRAAHMEWGEGSPDWTRPWRRA